ncbi:MAG: DUF4314 domain-containing protein [Alteromonadaceae bacterium]|nr:DUF4314 domain-containing protein [Alteromonadaceae bacterium]
MIERLSEKNAAPSRVQVLAWRERYTGVTIRLLAMPGDPDPIPSGTLGKVVDVDDAGSLIVQWEINRSLNVIVGTDKFEVVR